MRNSPSRARGDSSSSPSIVENETVRTQEIDASDEEDGVRGRPAETRHRATPSRERLEIGRTTLPVGHSLGNRASRLSTEKVPKSDMFDRLRQFMKLAKKTADVEERERATAAERNVGGSKDPIVMVSEASQDEPESSNSAVVDIVVVKATDERTSENSPRRSALIETVE